MTIENRLKEERERLGFTQPDFAELAGTTKKTVIDYEKGKSSPKASYLEAIAAVGADVNYIVNGVRSDVSEPGAGYQLRPDQMELLTIIEHCSDEDKKAIKRMAVLAAKDAEHEQSERASERAKKALS